MWQNATLRQLLFLETVLEEGSLVRAAERLHTTHSTLSRHMKALTDELGIGLFIKTPQGLKLSEVGRIYCAQIRSSLEQAKLAFDLARYESVRNQRPFHVGHSPYIHGALFRVLHQIVQTERRQPTIVLKSASTVQSVHRVLHGRFRAGFGVMPITDTRLWIERIAYEPFCICIPERHRLASRARLAMRELAGETLVWIPRSLHWQFYDQVASYLRPLGFDSRRFLEASTITQAFDFAALGIGVALIPQSASHFQRVGVLVKPLTDELMRIETSLFVRRDQMHSQVKDFIATALSAISKMKLKPLIPQ